MSRISYGVQDDFVDKKGNDLWEGNVVKIDGSDCWWTVKDLWMADEVPMVTLDDAQGNIEQRMTSCVLKI